MCGIIYDISYCCGQCLCDLHCRSYNENDIAAPFCIISPYETTSSLVNHPVDENMCKIFFDIHTFSFSAFYLRFDHIYLIFP